MWAALGTGYKKAYLFNGANGTIIWDYPYPGPSPSFGKTIISVDDLTGDGVPEAVFNVSNNSTSTVSKKTYCVNGATGQLLWATEALNEGPKELLEIPVQGETSDIIVGEYFTTLRRLDGETGIEIWSQTITTAIQMDLISDLNDDGVDDILLAAFSGGATAYSGADGSVIWSYPMDFQMDISAVPDLNADGYDDVVVAAGSNNPGADPAFYVISGKGDSLLFSQHFSGDPVNTVNVLPSIDGNASYELLMGSEDGKVICYSGGLNASTGIAGPEENFPAAFVLEQNYPNPFNPATTISFFLPEKSKISLKVYNVLGQEVATLIDREIYEPGRHRVRFNGRGLPSGFYIYRLESQRGVLNRKMILMK